MHCESCGKANPFHNEGFTACCGELICYGDVMSHFGTKKKSVTACCWAKAAIKFGGWEKIPDGSYRID